MSEIEPDTKDWTWVLREPCPDCGLESSAVAVEEIGGLVRASVPRWRAVLRRDDVTERPDAATWSPLEYAAHVRDVLRVFDERLALVLERDEPTFANWDQDAAALEGRYAEQDPAVLAEALAAAAATIADRFDAVPTDALGRRALRSNGSEFTLTTLGQYFWHDVAHHLHDVGA